MIIAADKSEIFLISGTGDVLEPQEGIVAIGSGGNFALSAARALRRKSDLSANRDNSYGGNSSRDDPMEQDASSQGGEVYPERIKAAYRDWCQYYGKEYNESRLGTFSSNFLF